MVGAEETEAVIGNKERTEATTGVEEAEVETEATVAVEVVAEVVLEDPLQGLMFLMHKVGQW